MTNATNGDKPAIAGVNLVGLSPEAIMGLMSKSRNRNAYGPKLVWFMDESDEAAINPREVWTIEFAEKEASTLYQGFLGAAKKAGLFYNEDNLDAPLEIKQSDGEVYILHRERVLRTIAEFQAAQETVAAK